MGYFINENWKNIANNHTAFCILGGPSSNQVKDIENIESFGEKVGQYNIQNEILVTINNSKNVNISKIKRDFLTNSSCGVCGKSSLDALEIIKKEKTPKSDPKLSKDTIIIVNSCGDAKKNRDILKQKLGKY